MGTIPDTRCRDHGFDNIRALLIICVVIGHLLEMRTGFSAGEGLYKVIYSFHMPVFLFVCGWFARFDRRTLLLGLLAPYLILQTAYIFFHSRLFQTDVVIQYTTPYWLLWFLPALFVYRMLLPLYDVSSDKQRILGLLAALAISLIVGYDETIGYELSLSRILVFQPWFMLGFYARNKVIKPMCFAGKLVLTAVLVILSTILVLSPVTGDMLYGSHNYAALNYGIGTRLFSAAIAFAWIAFFCLVVRPLAGMRIPLLTALGRNTLPVFLLHGFMVRYIGRRCPEMIDTPVGVIVTALLILMITGNSVTAALFRRVLPDGWISRAKR